MQKYSQGGIGELETKRRSGRPPKLNKSQRAKLAKLIIGRDPRQLRFDFALWTREMIAELIGRKFGVVTSISVVGRMLHGLGLSPQRPLWRAYQANPEAIEVWKTKEFPLIREQAQRAGAIVFFQDEAWVRSDFHAGTTWGVVGETPVVKTTGARYSVNMISSISAQGKLHFRLLETKVNSDVFIEYCQALLDDNPDRPVFLIVDGHPSHQRKTAALLPARLFSTVESR